MPYTSSFDCMLKIIQYECQIEKSSNYQAFYSGGQAYWGRLFLICYLSQFLLDYYHDHNYVSEYWSPPNFSRHGSCEDPFTDSFYKTMVSTYVGAEGNPAGEVTMQSDFILI